MGEQIQFSDPQQLLRAGDFQHVLDEVTDKVLGVMQDDKRDELDSEDRAFIGRRVHKMVMHYLQQYEAERSKPTRYKRAERVVCRLGGDRQWASGSIAAVNEDNPEDPMGPKLPYVVKLDPPSRLISVPKDDYDLCRAEVCFGQRAGALYFTLFCLPPIKQPANAKRRFDVGERVACAVEDETDDYSIWAAGTVLEVNYSVEKDATALLPQRDWEGDASIIPYRVQLDTGSRVLVHRDEHWLVRDLALQAVGPRQAQKGSRALTRLVKRHCGDYTFEAIDHMTRQVRPCAPPDSDDEKEEHDDDCLCCH